MSYAIVYERDGQLIAHQVGADREAIMHEYDRLKRAAPNLTMQVRQIPTGLALPVQPLRVFTE